MTERRNRNGRGNLVAALLAAALQAGAAEVKELRLVPFPKEIAATEGGFDLSRPLTLHAPAESVELIRNLLTLELQRAGLKAPSVAPSDNSASVFTLTAADPAADPTRAKREALNAKSLLRAKPGEEEYALVIDKARISCAGADSRGLLHGVQTLCQLIRANRTEQTIPCLSVRDWPSLKWRGFQNDMTRGPSAKLETLKGQIDLSSYLKMNLFSYYMEYQFAYSKHPLIGPADGSFTPAELKALVDYAATYAIEIMGNQQSFGHMTGVLKLPQYGHLAEYSDHNIHPNNRWSVSPACEETYQLLDDLWSDQLAVLPFNMFNVCCDEVGGLGTGPAKEMVAQLGAAEVYVRHVLRLHSMLKEKYGKRMLMWGDIILRHPDKLERIPKDVVMMTWDYSASADFEDKILPFAKSGYAFFVCPGVSSWNRVLPDFQCATVNIRNFVRDGVKLGALGMLNTDWKDDCQSLNATLWHGLAWGAECAWNASATEPGDFNRRIGAVLFGEKGDHFGKAIGLLSQTADIRGISDGNYPSNGFLNRRFWENDFAPKLELSATRGSAEKLLSLVRPALEHLQACRQDAQINAELLDTFIFGARRMELVGQRMLDGAEVILAYKQAYDGEPVQATAALEKITGLIRKNRDATEALCRQYPVLWNREVKPYALDRVLDRYANARKQYDELLARMDEAGKRVAAGKPLPAPAQLGLGADTLARHTWAEQEYDRPMTPETPWADPAASHRLGLTISAGNAERFGLPVELELTLPAEVRSKPVRAFFSIKDGPAVEVPAQLDPAGAAARVRLTIVISGPVPANAQAAVHVYLGLPAQPAALPQAVSTTDGTKGMKVLENDKVRLLLGPEGAHIYRWEVKALEGRDFTQPGETGWSGFSDIMGQLRAAPAQMTCLGAGPAMVRFNCAYASGETKQLTLFAGASWTEEMLSGVEGGYTDYDDPKSFAADGPTPGQYLFSGGEKGLVGKHADGRAAQVHVPAVWCIKFNDRKMALGLVTPEAATPQCVGPGGGWGGVGVNGKPPAHVVTFAGLLETEPDVTMKRLQQTLNLRNQPKISLFGLEQRNR